MTSFDLRRTHAALGEVGVPTEDIKKVVDKANEIREIREMTAFPVTDEVELIKHSYALVKKANTYYTDLAVSLILPVLVAIFVPGIFTGTILTYVLDNIFHCVNSGVRSGHNCIDNYRAAYYIHPIQLPFYVFVQLLAIFLIISATKFIGSFAGMKNSELKAFQKSKSFSQKRKKISRRKLSQTKGEMATEIGTSKAIQRRRKTRKSK